MLSFIIFICSIVATYYVEGYDQDQIQSLPGLSIPPKFKQYSGYLNATKGHYFHYWFVESQSNPEKDPVLLWLNGGPGCSSLFGLLTENGPFTVDSNGTTLSTNPYSWNTIANVIYLESPSWVGFSYSDIDLDHVKNSDDSTAERNYQAIFSFFKKFPQFKNNDFYITGESYGGIYVPMMAQKIFQNKQSGINLKGVAIGNGAMDQNMVTNTMPLFSYTHGDIDSTGYKRITSKCCTCSIGCDQKCNSTCIHNGLYNANVITKIINRNIIDQDKIPALSRSTNYIQTIINKRFKTELGLFDENLKQDKLSENYMFPYQHYLGLSEVRKALHIPDIANQWSDCMWVNYQEQYDTMLPTVKQLIDNDHLKIFIAYNGVLDFICNFLSGQQFVDDLGFQLDYNHNTFHVNKSKTSSGFIKKYNGNVYFIGVDKAYHMVPTDQPGAALQIVKYLIGLDKI